MLITTIIMFTILIITMELYECNNNKKSCMKSVEKASHYKNYPKVVPVSTDNNKNLNNF